MDISQWTFYETFYDHHCIVTWNNTV